MKVEAKTVALKSKYPFRTGHGVRYETNTFIVKLSKDGLTGLGEATPVPYYGVTPELMHEIISKNKSLIDKAEWSHPAELWDLLKEPLNNNTFVQCAIDMAAYDLWSQMKSMPLHRSLGINVQNLISSDYTIGIDSIEQMVLKLKEFDFPIFKIKLGTKKDIEIVKELRKHTNAIFRVDANCSWGVKEAVNNIKHLKQLNVEFIEQPLKANDIEGMKVLKRNSKLPLIADESCITEGDVDACFGLFDGINIKLAKCGGITPALRMIKNARSKGLKVMMGCMTESSVGISAIAHLVGLLDYVDMDGAMLISNDPAKGAYISGGTIIFADRNGTGAEWIGDF